MKHFVGKAHMLDVVVTREEVNFDRACDAAMSRALYLYGADDCGHQRSTDTVVLEFQTVITCGGITGREHNYRFVVWIERNDE